MWPENVKHCPYPREQLNSEISKRFLEINEKNIKIPIVKQRANCSKGDKGLSSRKNTQQLPLSWAFGFQIQSDNHLNCQGRKTLIHRRSHNPKCLVLPTVILPCRRSFLPIPCFAPHPDHGLQSTQHRAFSLSISQVELVHQPKA